MGSSFDVSRRSPNKFSMKPRARSPFSHLAFSMAAFHSSAVCGVLRSFWVGAMASCTASKISGFATAQLVAGFVAAIEAQLKPV